MAKKRKKKKKSSGATPPKLTPQKYIQTRARKLPFYKCLVSEGWQDSGMAVVMIARQQGGEKLVIGMYLLDIWCLGLKDTHYQFRMDNFEFENEFVPKMYNNRDIEPEEVAPVYAQNLIYRAIEYAEDLGFAPHKDFKFTERILDPADSLEEIEFEFGKDGMPHYMAGPHDNFEQILHTLARNLGMGNFKYTIPWMQNDGEDFEEEEDGDFAENVDFEEA